eukprot:TRINITY_DN19529_c0_g1_i1.p2 TRINITY_DN19529_c0_g1~~TRINITY_DN19529_c0_g1_i1.p2  ORF type:complete len:111 (+),score=45.36 TRINITY_DN19529_c0_g1_i1:64-396(+)
MCIRDSFSTIPVAITFSESPKKLMLQASIKLKSSVLTMWHNSSLLCCTSLFDQLEACDKQTIYLIVKLHSGKEHVSTTFLYLCGTQLQDCLLYTSPSPRDLSTSRMPSSA